MLENENSDSRTKFQLPAGDHFDLKLTSYQYNDSHYKGKMVSRHDVFYIETLPRFRIDSVYGAVFDNAVCRSC